MSGCGGDCAGHDRSLAAACGVLVLRALELAGKRATTRALRGQLQNVEPHKRYLLILLPPQDHDRLLAGAWSTLDIVLDDHCQGCGFDLEDLERRLDGHVRELLRFQEPYTFGGLTVALGLQSVVP